MTHVMRISKLSEKAKFVYDILCALKNKTFK